MKLLPLLLPPTSEDSWMEEEDLDLLTSIQDMDLSDEEDIDFKEVA